jgi:OOP family OmpA-OmpF porin
MRLLAVAVGLALGASAAGQERPAQTGRFLLFFDWGKPDVRGDDAETLDKVAAAWRARPSIHLDIIGHTDRSGSPATNRRAGLKRAETVRAELEKRGVSRNAMSVASFGEEQPLVPTEDGVREVQNRRVVIELKE